jgi:hypothetical protein
MQAVGARKIMFEFSDSPAICVVWLLINGGVV